LLLTRQVTKGKRQWERARAFHLNFHIVWFFCVTQPHQNHFC